MLFCIIDDEREVCDLLRLFFEARGHPCVLAYDGATGLELIRKHKPTAVFLDVAMPRMNGFEVLTKLRSEPELAGLPVLLMSALVREQQRSPEEWAKATGATAFIEKPFELDELLRIVEQLTGVKA